MQVDAVGIEQQHRAQAAFEQRLVVPCQLLQQAGQGVTADQPLHQCQPLAVTLLAALEPGDVGHHRDAAGLAVVLRVVRLGHDVNDAAVTPPVAPFAHVHQPPHGGHAVTYRGLVFRQVQVGQVQPSGFVLGVAVQGAEGLVHAQHGQRSAFVQEHRRRVACEQPAVFILGPAQRGDVAPDAQHPQQPAGAVTHRRLDRLHQFAVTVVGEGQLLLVDAGAPLGHGPAVVQTEVVGQLARHEVIVGAAADLRFGGTVQAFEARVAGDVDPSGSFSQTRSGMASSTARCRTRSCSMPASITCTAMARVSSCSSSTPTTCCVASTTTRWRVRAASMRSAASWIVDFDRQRHHRVAHHLGQRHALGIHPVGHEPRHVA
jgi:hypothetical protein